MTKEKHNVTIQSGLGFSAYVTNDGHVHIYQLLDDGREFEVRLNRLEVRELCRSLPCLVADLESQVNER